MLNALIRAALGQRLVVAALALLLCAFGLREATRLSVDAFPDVTNVQVQIATEATVVRPKKSSDLSPCHWKLHSPACLAWWKCAH